MIEIDMGFVIFEEKKLWLNKFVEEMKFENELYVQFER